MNNNTNWQARNELLLGKDKLGIIHRANVLVVGVGGVGAYAAEMLVRSGVGRMTIVDSDTVNPTNINRQLIALHSSVGKTKVEVLGDRLLDINPSLALRKEAIYLRDELTDEILDSEQYDFVVDAIDTLAPKAALIKSCMDRAYPLVSSMGAGAKTDPTKVEIADISKTHHCPLAHMLRKRIHKMGIRKGFWAVFSAEPVREGAMVVMEDGAEQNKKSMVGTVSYMPAVFGCAAASVALRALLGEMQ